MAPVLSFLISSGSKKKEPRYACLSEAKAAHSYKMWTEVSSSVPHFLQVVLLLSPIVHKCLLKVLCPVRRPITTLDCVLLKGNNRALVARSGPEINSRACLCVLQGPPKMPLIIMSTKILKWGLCQRSPFSPRTVYVSFVADKMTLVGTVRPWVIAVVISVSSHQYSVLLFIDSIVTKTLFVKLVGIRLEATISCIFSLLSYEYLAVVHLFRLRNWRNELENIRPSNCFVFGAAENVMNWIYFANVQKFNITLK
jgi:hypothetical protein